eukprot:TRINITY_DN63471_c0_g1_i1.p1 TRINITY_DN63471_c0_g1~~TRINITY_DN63471_c0_g1_i1.p1  ORF type:complete len:519 (+),score=114.68 TRINITY_DN63471_c0_g1_i1:166-1722(+)
MPGQNSSEPQHPLGKRAERCEVLADFHTTDGSCLELRQGEIIYVLKKKGDWFGGHKDGDERTGWFPGAYVQPVEDDEEDLEDGEISWSGLCAQCGRDVGAQRALERGDRPVATPTPALEARRRANLGSTSTAATTSSRVQELDQQLEDLRTRLESERTNWNIERSNYQEDKAVWQKERLRYKDDIRQKNEELRQATERLRLLESQLAESMAAHQYPAQPPTAPVMELTTMAALATTPVPLPGTQSSIGSLPGTAANVGTASAVGSGTVQAIATPVMSASRPVSPRPWAFAQATSGASGARTPAPALPQRSASAMASVGRDHGPSSSRASPMQSSRQVQGQESAPAVRALISNFERRPLVARSESFPREPGSTPKNGGSAEKFFGEGGGSVTVRTAREASAYRPGGCLQAAQESQSAYRLQHSNGDNSPPAPTVVFGMTPMARMSAPNAASAANGASTPGVSNALPRPRVATSSSPFRAATRPANRVMQAALPARNLVAPPAQHVSSVKERVRLLNGGA